MREAADLQDKVGQGEVDIPAREMLADMLLELHQPQLALAEYRAALKLSPNRFNGLYNAGVAAEQAGDKTAAADYFAALLKSTGNGAQSSRPELAHAKSFLSSDRLADNQSGSEARNRRRADTKRAAHMRGRPDVSISERRGDTTMSKNLHNLVVKELRKIIHAPLSPILPVPQRAPAHRLNLGISHEIVLVFFFRARGLSPVSPALAIARLRRCRRYRRSPAAAVSL